MVDEPMSHFHFYVFKPNRKVAVVDIEGTFPYAAGTAEILLLFFPLSIFDPNRSVPTTYAACVVFKLFPLVQTVLCKRAKGKTR
jgi:hypothetical protein